MQSASLFGKPRTHLLNFPDQGLLTRVLGKRKIEYWISHERWWEFLSRASITEIEKLIWIDWIALFSALSKVWIALNGIDKERTSPIAVSG